LGKDVWVISGINVTVDINTTLNGDFEVGNPVVAAGVIGKNGTWLAKSVELIRPEEYRFEFTGKVQSLGPWTVAGISFDTGEFTEIDADINVGNTVRVTGIVSTDGIWTAELIEKLNTDHQNSFTFFGPVVSINPWNVREVPLAVDERTSILGDIKLGDRVKVSGWIMEDGTWLATEIRRIDWHTGQGCFLTTSVVGRINNDQITLIDGQTVTRTGDLAGSGDLKEGSVVRYHLCVDEHGEGTIVDITITMVNQQEGLSPRLTESGKVVICHIPPGNPANRHTIEVGEPAVSAHLAHGDTLGTCPGK
jgi:hypothetical protein